MSSKNVLCSALFSSLIISLLLATPMRAQLPFYDQLPFRQIVIWGHKLHSHTHSYVHAGFERACKHLGYPTYWLDNNDNTSGFDFSQTLFITEHQVDQNVPIRDDCFYIVHHNLFRPPKYANVKHGHFLRLVAYTDERIKGKDLVEIAPCTFYSMSEQTIYLLWATDLLPHEIDENKRKIESKLVERKKSKSVVFIGTIGGNVFGNITKIEPFKQACSKNGYSFVHKTKVSMKENMQLVQDAYMAPAIQGPWQCENGYPPCRIFKNISYGHIGITNCPTVQRLFDGKLVYNLDTYQLFFDAQRKIESLDIQELFELMDFVRDNHTYITRMKQLIEVFSLVYQTHNPT